MFSLCDNYKLSRWSLPKVLQPFGDNFMIMCFRCAASEMRHLIFRCYIIDECRDIICDVRVLHMH